MDDEGKGKEVTTCCLRVCPARGPVSRLRPGVNRASRLRDSEAHSVGEQVIGTAMLRPYTFVSGRNAARVGVTSRLSEESSFIRGGRRERQDSCNTCHRLGLASLIKPKNRRPADQNF